MGLLRQELNNFTERWNSNLLAPSKGAILPIGRPASLYHLPELFGSVSWVIPVSSEDIIRYLPQTHLMSALNSKNLQILFLKAKISSMTGHQISQRRSKCIPCWLKLLLSMAELTCCVVFSEKCH